MQPLNFVGPSYIARSRNFEASRTINLYPEGSESGMSKDVAMLIGTPGLRPFATLGGGGVRGAIRFSASQAIVCAGNRIYGVSPTGVATLFTGNVDSATTPVSMATNGSVVMVVTGPNGYVVTPSAGLVTQIVNPAFFGADRVDFIDNYFVFNRPGTGIFQITSLGGTAIDPLDFATAEVSPDNLVGLVTSHREIWLMGENTTEIYFNSGNPDFPFSPIQGTVIQQGCIAPHSIRRFDQSLAWLTQDEDGQGMVVKSSGYQAERISTHAVELAINSYSRIDDAIGFCYQQEGHKFYMLTFPTGNATWVFDSKTQLWHERLWRDPSDNSLNRHRANFTFFFAGKIIVGDWSKAQLYYFDLDFYTDNGDPLPAIRQVPHVYSADNNFMFFHKLWIDMQTGVGDGDPSSQGFDPTVVLDWSNDGGYSFPIQKTAKVGKIGERQRRVNFRRLGKGRDRVWRVTVTDPVKRIFIGAGYEATEGTA